MPTSKLTPVLLMPIFMVCMAGLILVLPAISPRKFEVDAFRSTFNYVMLLVIGLFGALHVMILQATLRGSFPFDRAFGVVFFLFFALMGNVLGKVRRNFWMGIRTPWTIADERVWDRTHRLAARMWTVGGAIGVILALAGVPFMFWMIYLIVLTTWPVVMSFFIYQRLNRGGSLAS